MSLTSIQQGNNSVDVYSAISKYDTKGKATLTLLVFVVSLLTTPLWLSPILGVGVGSLYLFMLAHGGFALLAQALLKGRAMALVLQNKERQDARRALSDLFDPDKTRRSYSE